MGGNFSTLDLPVHFYYLDLRSALLDMRLSKAAMPEVGAVVSIVVAGAKIKLQIKK